MFRLHFLKLFLIELAHQIFAESAIALELGLTKPLIERGLMRESRIDSAIGAHIDWCSLVVVGRLDVDKPAWVVVFRALSISDFADGEGVGVLLGLIHALHLDGFEFDLRIEIDASKAHRTRQILESEILIGIRI